MKRFCKGHNCEVDVDEFYKRKDKPYGALCKVCLCAKNRDRWVNGYRERQVDTRVKYREENKEKLTQYLSDYYATPVGRAKTMMKTIKQRMRKWDAIHLLDFDENYLVDLMREGCCSVTGVEFDYYKQDRFKCNPYSPSVDRVDSTKFYTKDNVRMVVWQYNLMKGELTDSELRDFCERIIK